jgi:hypothetical protein
MPVAWQIAVGDLSHLVEGSEFMSARVIVKRIHRSLSAHEENGVEIIGFQFTQGLGVFHKL